MGKQALLVALGSFVHTAATLISAVDLGTAGDFAILTKTGVTTTGVTRVTGDIGASPIAATSMTGFVLVADPSNKYSTSTLVNGNIYAADYAIPTPTKMTTAISDMETAYTEAAGDKGTPTGTEYAAGDVNGPLGDVNLTLKGGLYKWSSSVEITTNLTFDAQGEYSTVWIMQIAGNLLFRGAQAMNSDGAKVLLANGAQSKNIFWQVAGSTNIGNFAYAKGIILCKTAIVFNNGASLIGRALTQTAVTMISNTVTAPCCALEVRRLVSVIV